MPIPLHEPTATAFPAIRSVGVGGMVVSFGNVLTEPANRAALAFRAALEAAGWDGVRETSTSLASVFVGFDPLDLAHAILRDRLRDMVATRDWYHEPLPPGRKSWRVPCVYGTDLAPQLEEAAEAAGMTAEQAVESLGSSRVRVLTIGFAPGQPYLGPLGSEWNLPRQKELTPMVPAGALVQAISQMVLFTGPAPTGWRHVGQTAFRCFRPGGAVPIPLTPGDEMLFEPVRKSDFLRIRERDETGDGGATWREIAP